MELQELYELIEKQNGVGLSAEEDERLKAFLDANPELKDELHIHKKVDDAILDDMDMANFKALVAEADKSYFTKENIVRLKPNRGRYFLIAASVALIACLSLWMYTNQPASPETLFADYFESYDVITPDRSDDPITMGLLAKGIETYRNKDFDKSLAIFQELEEAGGAKTSATFYQALCMIELNKHPEQVESSLQVVISEENSPFTQHAKWYLALHYLRGDDIERAQHLLKGLSKENGKFGKLSKELLGKLSTK